MNDLIPDFKTSDIVGAYKTMLDELEKGVMHLNRVHTLYETIIGGKYGSGFNLDSRAYHSHSPEDITRMKKDVLVNCWQVIFERIKNLLPTREIQAFEKQINERNVPEFNEENINKILFSFVARGEEFKKAMIEETFDFLRPWNTGYKTNKRSALTDKCILTYAVSIGSSYKSLNYGRTNNSLWDMDKIFHLLDGQGMPQYPGNLITVIQDAMREKKQECETQYFKVKWFNNGNMHLKFKRMDLVNEINRIAGCDKLAA